MNTRLTTPLNNQPSSALDLKPLFHIDTLINHVVPAAKRMIIARGETVHYYKDDVRQCFLLIQGSVALHRRGDGIVLNSESAPFILGVSSQFSSEHLYVRALETAEIARVPWKALTRLCRSMIYGSTFQSCLFIPPRGYTNIARKYRKCLPTISSGSSLLS